MLFWETPCSGRGNGLSERRGSVCSSLRLSGGRKWFCLDRAQAAWLEVRRGRTRSLEERETQSHANVVCTVSFRWGEHWPFLSREVTPFIRVSANPSESNTKNWHKWSLEAGQLSKGYYSNPDGKLRAPELRLWTAECERKDSSRPQTWSWRDWMQVPREERIKGSASEKIWEFRDTLLIQSLAKNEVVYKARFPPGLLITWSKIK